MLVPNRNLARACRVLYPFNLFQHHLCAEGTPQVRVHAPGVAGQPHTQSQQQHLPLPDRRSRRQNARRSPSGLPSATLRIRGTLVENQRKINDRCPCRRDRRKVQRKFCLYLPISGGRRDRRSAGQQIRRILGMSVRPQRRTLPLLRALRSGRCGRTRF